MIELVLKVHCRPEPLANVRILEHPHIASKELAEGLPLQLMNAYSMHASCSASNVSKRASCKVGATVHLQPAARPRVELDSCS